MSGEEAVRLLREAATCVEQAQRLLGELDLTDIDLALGAAIRSIDEGTTN